MLSTCPTVFVGDKWSNKARIHGPPPRTMAGVVGVLADLCVLVVCVVSNHACNMRLGSFDQTCLLVCEWFKSWNLPIWIYFSLYIIQLWTMVKRVGPLFYRSSAGLPLCAGWGSNLVNFTGLAHRGMYSIWQHTLFLLSDIYCSCILLLKLTDVRYVFVMFGVRAEPINGRV